MKRNIILLIMLCFIFCSCSDFYYMLNPEAEYDYSDWYETEIPTLTDYRTKIKIPNNWSFIEENNIITLINNDTKEIIAEQVSQERYQMFFTEIGTYDYDILLWTINNPKIDANILSEDKYQSERGFSSCAVIRSYCDNGISYDVLVFNVYSNYCLNIEHYLSMKLCVDIEYSILDQALITCHRVTISKCKK